MEKKKEDIFKAFTAKAVQRLKDKKVTKYETLYVPSIDQNIKIRNLNYPELVDIFEMNEITSIATEIMKLSGVIGSKKVTVVEEQKNS